MSSDTEVASDDGPTTAGKAADTNGPSLVTEPRKLPPVGEGDPLSAGEPVPTRGDFSLVDMAAVLLLLRVSAGRAVALWMTLERGATLLRVEPELADGGELNEAPNTLVSTRLLVDVAGDVLGDSCDAVGSRVRDSGTTVSEADSDGDTIGPRLASEATGRTRADSLGRTPRAPNWKPARLAPPRARFEMSPLLNEESAGADEPATKAPAAPLDAAPAPVPAPVAVPAATLVVVAPALTPRPEPPRGVVASGARPSSLPLAMEMSRPLVLGELSLAAETGECNSGDGTTSTGVLAATATAAAGTVVSSDDTEAAGANGVALA